MRGMAIAFLLIASLASGGEGGIYHVDQNAPGPTHDGASWDTAFLQIRQALRYARDGDEIWVVDGTYLDNLPMRPGLGLYGGFRGAEPGGYETSLGERDWMGNVTVIDGSGVATACCVTMADNAVVDGFTVANGPGKLTNDLTYGGGFHCFGIGGAVIRNCTIVNNTADFGAGIYCCESSVTISGNVIASNLAHEEAGGVLSCWGAQCDLTNNIIVDNVSESVGGGVVCAGEEAVLILANSIVAGNMAAEHGGGICCSWSTESTIVNATVVDNLAPLGRGLACDSLDGWAPCSVRVANSILWNGGDEVWNDRCDLEIIYSDIWGGYTGEGNVDDDPCFARPERGRYELTWASPCLDAGDNTMLAELAALLGVSVSDLTDIDGERRVFGWAKGQPARVDMGANELHPKPSMRRPDRIQGSDGAGDRADGAAPR